MQLKCSQCGEELVGMVLAGGEKELNQLLVRVQPCVRCTTIAKLEAARKEHDKWVKARAKKWG